MDNLKMYPIIFHCICLYNAMKIKNKKHFNKTKNIFIKKDNLCFI